MVGKSKKRFDQWITMILIVLLALIFHPKTVNAILDTDIMNIYGRVKDESGNPIAGVAVYFADEATPAFYTNSNGEYSIWVNAGTSGNLRFEKENKEIQSIDKSVTISYSNMYNIDVVYSFPATNSAVKTVYEDIVNTKIGQIVKNSGKNYNPIIINDNVITEGEKRLTLNRNSIKCLHINYADEWMGNDIIEKLNQPGRLYNGIYELYVSPMNDTIKNNIQSQVTSRKILCKLFDSKEANGQMATEIIKAICDQNSTITKSGEKEENLDFSGNQINSITVNDDREINIIMKDQDNGNANNNSNNSSNNTVNLGQGQGIIEGYATGCEQDGTAEVIEKVKVELKDENNNVIAESRTDANGYYKFEGIKGAEFSHYDSEGNAVYNSKKYKVNFVYGDSEQLAINAKYNGQDYEATQGTEEDTELSYNVIPEETTTPGTTTPGTTDPDQVVTVDGEKVELYLVIDCSTSMQHGTDIHYGVNTRLDKAKEGAKQFIEKIFDRYGNNAKIGLTEFECFAGWKTDFKTSSEKQNLIDRVDNLEIIIGANHTRLDRAVSDTVDYMNDDGNRDTTGNTKRYMIVLTDGLSTNEKNVIIDAYTKARNNNITPLTILIDFDDGSGYRSPNSKAEFVKKSEIPEYLVETGYTLVSTDEIVSSLADTAYTYIIEGKTIPPTSTPDSTSVTYQTNITTKLGSKNWAIDNSIRRGEVNNYTKTIGFKKGEKLRQFETSGGISDSDLANETWMEATTGVITFTTPWQTFKDVNLQLKERNRHEVTVKKEISRVQLYLSDNSKMIDWKKDENNNITGIGTNYILDATRGTNGQMLITLDDEITQGATMKLTYRIKLESSGVTNATYTIYDYLDSVLGFSSKEADDDTGSLVNENWNIVDLSAEDCSDEIKKGTKTVVKTTMQSGDTKEITLTKVLSQNDEGRYENWCEIAEYSNDEGRRIYATTPANCNSDPFTRTSADPIENDTAKADVVGVVPPFGINVDDAKETIVSGLRIIGLLTIMMMAIIYKKKDKK